MNIETIAQFSKGVWSGIDKAADIEEFVTDTRKIKQPQKAIFVALKAFRDGHEFIADAYEKGIRNFLISDSTFIATYNDVNYVLVDNTLQALQSIAQQHRKLFNFPVIGITGSNGKTIIKEWLGQLLADHYTVVKSPKSYNSQIGVALSVLKITTADNLGVFEAGISQPGEMSRLYQMIKPTMGIFTNVNEAHNEGFLNERQKINEKLQLFADVEVLIYNRDYAVLHENVLQFAHKIKESKGTSIQLFDWSYQSQATLRILTVATENIATTITAKYKEDEISITIPFKDKAYVENAIHCWCTLLALGVRHEEITNLMHGLQPVAMRMELKHGVHDSIIINDTYSSDLTSLNIALDFLIQQPKKRRTLIISDIFQIGKPDIEVFEEIAQQMQQKQIHTLIGVGTSLSRNKHVFEAIPRLDSYFFPSTEEFLKQIHQFSFDQNAILIKGARKFKFEKIEKILVDKVHNTILEINLSDMLHNLKIYRSFLKPKVKTMAMVKAYSYGSGSYEIANELQMSGVDYLTVAYIDEGIALREAGITLPIMVMNPDLNMLDRMIIWNLEPEVYSSIALKAVLEQVAALDRKAYPIHIKLDTGMHRLGFLPEDLDSLLATLQATDLVQVKSIFTHLVGSDSSDFDAFTQEQHSLYEQMSSRIIQKLAYPVIRHLSNTAAIALHPELQYDMVRLGIGLYGIDTTNTIQHLLKPIGVLKTHITQIKKLQAGETVGYSRRGILHRDSIIATVNIGYADGYFRDFGNGKAYMMINDQKAPLVGTVCMDMCMLDITDIPNVAEGDEVIVYGKGLHIQQLAEWANTIPYEILTSISQRVKRVYIND